jgi:hypothetical protein
MNDKTLKKVRNVGFIAIVVLFLIGYFRKENALVKSANPDVFGTAGQASSSVQERTSNKGVTYVTLNVSRANWTEHAPPVGKDIYFLDATRGVEFEVCVDGDTSKIYPFTSETFKDLRLGKNLDTLMFRILARDTATSGQVRYKVVSKN